MIDKTEVLELPTFPEWDENVITGAIEFESSVNVPVDGKDVVLIYKVPVVRTFKKFILGRSLCHSELRKKFMAECMRFSKYTEMSEDLMQGLPLVAILNKHDDDFLYKLHYQYI